MIIYPARKKIVKIVHSFSTVLIGSSFSATILTDDAGGRQRKEEEYNAK